MKNTSKTTNKTASSTVVVDRELAATIQSRIITLLGRKNGSWNGTMTDLNRAITTGIRRAVPAAWPSTPSVLRRVINGVIPALRRAGVSVSFTRTSDHMRTRVVSLTVRQ